MFEGMKNQHSEMTAFLTIVTLSVFGAVLVPVKSQPNSVCSCTDATLTVFCDNYLELIVYDIQGNQHGETISNDNKWFRGNVVSIDISNTGRIEATCKDSGVVGGIFAVLDACGIHMETNTQTNIVAATQGSPPSFEFFIDASKSKPTPTGLVYTPPGKGAWGNDPTPKFDSLSLTSSARWVWDASLFNTLTLGLEFPCTPAQTCYIDSPERVLKGSSVLKSNEMTSALCMEFCEQNGYHYFGVEFGSECFCGNDVHANSTLIVQNDCEGTPCAGNPSEFCGGYWRVLVGETNLNPSLYNISAKCFVDDETRVLSGTILDGFHSNINTPYACQQLCRREKYSYFGVEYGSECFCGNDIDHDRLGVAPGECNMRCRNFAALNCGGRWRIAIGAT